MWNLAYYAVGPTIVFIQTDASEHGPFFQTLQTDAIAQGDGFATPTFGAAYTLNIIPPMTRLFPVGSFDHPLIHDDTTFIAATIRPPSDDPDLTRFHAASDAQLTALITAYAQCGASAVRIAHYLLSPSTRDPPHPAVSALAHYAIPHFPLIIAVFEELITSRLGLKMAPGKKMTFFQHPQPPRSRIAIRATSPDAVSLWTPLLPKGVSFTHTNYVLAGAHVGTYPTIDSALAHSIHPYLSLLRDIASLPLRHVYPTFLAIKVAYSPTSKFGHHFSAQPPTITKTTASVTRAAIIDATERLLGLNIGTIAQSPATNAADVRLCAPVSDGGCGLADPTSQRLTAFAATFINILPLLTQNPTLEKHLANTASWKQSPSLLLREAHATITFFAKLSAAPEPSSAATLPHHVDPEHCVGFLSALTSAVSHGNGDQHTINLTTLAAAAHRHGHRSLARVHHIHSTAVALSAPPRGPLDDIAAATRNASRLRGSDALFNAMTIDSRSNLGTNHAIFLICHRLTLPLPFLSPPFYCHPDCKHLPQPPSRYQGPLVIDGSHNLFQHGYHQAQCPKHWCPTTRHNQWIDSVVKDLRKWAGVVCQVAQQLYHSENNNRTVDLLVYRPDRPSEPATMAESSRARNDDDYHYFFAASRRALQTLTTCTRHSGSPSGVPVMLMRRRLLRTTTELLR